MNLLRDPLLRSVFTDAGIKLVDIGAGGNPKREMVALAPVAHFFACEPDEERAQALVAKMTGGDGGWRDLTVIREAMASQEGEATLYETAKPGWTSLLRPDPRVGSQYLPNGAYQVVSETTVSTITLDQAAARYSFEDACFLKIDTQGTELEILQSGSRMLERSIVGVYLEANFRPFYVNQSLFSDTDPFLRGHDFVLLEVRRTLLRPRGFQNDVYSKRHPVWAHCLYLRDPAVLAERPDDEARPLLVRYLALCLSYQHFDLALAVATEGRAAELLAGVGGPELASAVEALVRGETRRRLRNTSDDEREVLLARSERY